MAAWIGWLGKALAPVCKRTRVESWAGLADVTYRCISVTIRVQATGRSICVLEKSWMGVIEGAGYRRQARAGR